MSKIFKKLKGFWSLGVAVLLSLMFVKGTKALPAPPVNTTGTFYGVIGPEVTYFPIGICLAFIVAPIAGLIWYHKRGGTKKWPRVILWIIAGISILALIALIFSLFFLL